MRIGGLASGMDIDSIVKDLMKAERMPLTKIKQKKQTLEWQRDDFRSINTMLLNFRSELTQMKLSSRYRARSTTSTDESKVTATATSAAALASYSISRVDQLASAATKVNTGAVSASSSSKVDLNKGLYEAKDTFANSNFNWLEGSVESQTINVTEAKAEFKLNLSEGVNVQRFGQMNVTVNGVAYEVKTGIDASELADNQVLADASGNLTFKNPIAKDSSVKVDYIASHKVDKITISTEDTTSFNLSKGSVSSGGFTIKTGEDSKDYVFKVEAGKTVWEITDATDPEKIVGSVDTTTGKVMMFEKIAKDSEIEANYKQNYFNFELTTHTSKGPITQDFNIQGTESLSSVLNKVNTSNLGVTMFYDSFKDQFTLTRKETGNFNGIGPTETGFATDRDANHEIITRGAFLNQVLKFGGAAETGGENAKFVINGLETERNTNTFAVSGVTFTLKKTFNDAPVSVNINNNNDQIFDNIKNFIDKYNELISKIQGEVREERFRSYTPLTDEQREQLSEKQQEQWEEKAKSGMLRRDPTLSSLLSKMRLDFYSPVANEEINPLYRQLSSIGIKTTANYLEGGKLEIDEAALRKAIEEDPASVEKLFNATGATDGQRGVAQRLFDSVGASMETVRQKAGNSFSTNKQFEIGKQLDDIDSRINRFETRLKQVEDRYWKQFTAMEKAVQKANQQSMYLMQQFQQ